MYISQVLSPCGIWYTYPLISTVLGQLAMPENTVFAQALKPTPEPEYDFLGWPVRASKLDFPRMGWAENSFDPRQQSPTTPSLSHFPTVFSRAVRVKDTCPQTCEQETVYSSHVL
jgi:hypothetical protein